MTPHPPFSWRMKRYSIFLRDLNNSERAELIWLSEPLREREKKGGIDFSCLVFIENVKGMKSNKNYVESYAFSTFLFCVSNMNEVEGEERKFSELKLFFPSLFLSFLFSISLPFPSQFPRWNGDLVGLRYITWI